MMPAVTFSNQILEFMKGSQECDFTVNNNSPNLVLYFKVKASKLNTYEVKPAKGSIQPEKNKIINFKIIKPLLSIEEIDNLQTKDKFMVELLKVSTENLPKSKKELQDFWSKEKSIGSKSIESYTLSIQIDHDYQRKQKKNLFETVIPNSPSRFSNKNFFEKKKSFPDRLSAKTEEQNIELANEYQKLKEQEELLVRRREQIFYPKQTPSKKPKSSILSAIILIVMFLVGVLVGNFLKQRVLV